ncbi:hypothetical protein POPTR_007G062362v4 [Populus trichocarpa]|jgi:5-methylcytosine-specific restriction endonuclease McrA|uniref:Uncharacterized protein n=1 Tax=Populus trichocarpa TaxID=3694 RepID=A0ACC0SPW5_POPTR|nr:hypothetical protein POPTR_007G062362v4 [Populus trichocarpa]
MVSGPSPSNALFILPHVCCFSAAFVIGRCYIRLLRRSSLVSVRVVRMPTFDFDVEICCFARWSSFVYEKQWATLRRLRAQSKRVDACAPCLPDFLEVDLSLVLFLSRGANEKAWFRSQLESLSPINRVSATTYEISKSSFDPHNQTPAFGMKESGIGVSHRATKPGLFH